MKSKTIHLRWYTDPSHAWLQVSRRDAEKLGCLHRFSQYSYQSAKGNTLYLEEDCDAAIFLRALNESTEYLPCYSIDKRSEKWSWIRSLPHFSHRDIAEDDTTLVCYRYDGPGRTFDQLEAYCRKLDPRFRLARPSNEAPWNYEVYAEVLENAEEWIKERTGLFVYWNIDHYLVVTSDSDRAERDLALVYNRIKISQEGSR